MAFITPFRALRPRPSHAARIAAVPYDVVNTEEARALAEGNPFSFLRVSRAEVELPAETDPYSNQVYEHAKRNFEKLRAEALVVEDEPSLYVYRLRMGAHAQVGIAGCFSVDEYNRDVVKKHERTRRDKEDDRTRHILTLRAQTGPVLLTFVAAAGTMDVLTEVMSSGAPLFDVTASDGIQHTVWRADAASRDRIVAAVGRVPALYIADGHHRAASAARTDADMRERGAAGSGLGDGAGAGTFLAVAFPHDQMQVLPYNRVVKDLAGRSPEAFMDAVRERFEVEPGPATPAAKGQVAMYLQGRWFTLRPRTKPAASDVIASLDVSVLQDQLLTPVLNIVDVRTDKRIDFVGGARGTAELERLVDSGKAAVAFSMFPVTVDDLMAVSDAGEIMPPKSTWFEPKLRDGLLIHVI